MEQYTAVGISSTVWGVRKRKEVLKNIEHIHEVVAAASWLSSLDLPVKLIALPEGGLQGFTDEVFDMDHVEYAMNIAIDIPGEETDRLGEIAKQYNAYLIAQAKATDERFPNRFFNNAFIINPQGRIILRHYKNSPLFPVEHSICP
ncbi:MAG: nitrilase-related carbon-nitrogen hydrolase, partial [Candidatus Caldarchaeum sp.]